MLAVMEAQVLLLPLMERLPRMVAAALVGVRLQVGQVV